MAGVSLMCGDCGTLLKSVEEAQEHAELTKHTNFSESTEAVLNLVCSACGKPCRSKTDSDLHTKRTGHAEFVDRTSESTKPISLEAPKPQKDVEMEETGDGSGTQQEEMVVPEVNQELLKELEEMGFPKERTIRALHYSGNVSAEAAVNWIVEHENDSDIDQMPLVPVSSKKPDAPKPSLTPEEIKQKQQELRERARKKKEEEEKQKEREREKERVRVGRELLEAKRIEEDNERKRMLALRKAEKEEEKRAREKIRQKLDEDKAERRRKLGLPPEDPAAIKPSAPPTEEKKSSLPVRPATKAEQMRECLRTAKQNHKPIVKVLEDKREVQVDQRAKVIDWEDYEQELARLCSLTSALEESRKKKNALDQKLNSFIQGEAESLNQSNELDQMRERLEYRKLVMGNMSMDSKVVKEKVRKQEELLSAKIRSLLAGGTSLSVASRRMQDSIKSLAGEKGYDHLKKLQRLLRLRQQCLVSQVSFLYPVKVVIGKVPEQELESFSSSIKPGVSTGSKPINQASLTISGLHLTMIPFTKMSFFTDKKEVQRSSTALGYVSHVVSLVASYLHVPLRYPFRLGGSRSYIQDYAPSIEHLASSSILDPTISTSSKPVEFPLFLEGQDSTRAAYAVFLLNKDLEQLLNFIGVKSLGPRHILANLKELLRTIVSPEYIDT